MTTHRTVAPRSARGRINSAVLAARLCAQRQSEHDGRARRLAAGAHDDLAAQLRRRLEDLAGRIEEVRRAD